MKNENYIAGVAFGVFAGAVVNVLLTAGNGFVAMAVHTVSASVAALYIAATQRPTRLVQAGLDRLAKAVHGRRAAPSTEPNAVNVLAGAGTYATVRLGDPYITGAGTFGVFTEGSPDTLGTGVFVAFELGGAVIADAGDRRSVWAVLVALEPGSLASDHRTT